MSLSNILRTIRVNSGFATVFLNLASVLFNESYTNLRINANLSLSCKTRLVQNVQHEQKLTSLDISAVCCVDDRQLWKMASELGLSQFEGKENKLFQGLRQLLQAKDEKSDNVLQTPSFNLSCTWSDPLNSCYLDYFNHLPDSEISNFYNTDEVALLFCQM